MGEFRWIITILNPYKVIGLSTKTYYIIKNHDDSVQGAVDKDYSNRLLALSEEQKIIDEIGKAQWIFDCLRGFDIKGMAQKMYFNHIDEQMAFGRDCFFIILYIDNLK